MGCLRHSFQGWLLKQREHRVQLGRVGWSPLMSELPRVGLRLGKGMAKKGMAMSCPLRSENAQEH